MSWNESSFVSADVRDIRVTAFLSKVYGWMFLGLLITAGTAVVVASSPALIETLIAQSNLVLDSAVWAARTGVLPFRTSR